MQDIPIKKAIAVIALLLSGCVAGPQFQRPAAPATPGYTVAPLPGKTASAPVSAGGGAQSFMANGDVPAEWWASFESAPLNRLVERARAANPGVQAAKATLRAAEESLAAGKGVILPALDAQAGVTREKTNTGGVPASPFTLYNASVKVSYSPDLFGGTSRTIEVAAAQAEAQRFQLEAAYLTLEANVVTSAIQEASLKAQIAATREMIGIQKSQLKALRSQFELGGVAKAAVLAQKAALAETRASIFPLQKQLAQVRNQLKVLAGNSPAEKNTESFRLEGLRLPAELPVSLPSRLVEQRPDIRMAEAQMHAASAAVGVARANMLPQITLSGAYGYSAATSGDLFSPGALAWNAGAGVLQPLFHGGELEHKRRAAVAAYDAAAADYRSAVLLAFQNVSDALRALQFDADTLKARAAAERAARDSLHLAQKQYDAGAISYLALLDGARVYQQARIGLVTAEAARYADTAALFAALGGGWWNRGEKNK